MLSRPTPFTNRRAYSLRSASLSVSRPCVSARNAFHYAAEPANKRPLENSAMARMSTKEVLRSLILISLMSSDIVLRPALAMLRFLSSSRSAMFNADRNPILNKLLRLTVYGQFCAGSNHSEVSKTVESMKRAGYQGIILGYAKEAMLDHDDRPFRDQSVPGEYSDKCHRMVEEWEKGTLKSLRMIGPGDFLAIKITGAGPIAVDALAAREPMPEVIARAVNEICFAVQKQGSRLWIDAEQQVLQRGLDDWAIEIMRKHNRTSRPVVYNTIQAYLKGSNANIDRHCALAAQEGWSLGIKLVRGAYIEHETRSLIHDTKEETDTSYDLIADNMLCLRMSEEAKHLDFPKVALFLATHNGASAAKAISTHQKRHLEMQGTVSLECGQVQGMADELSCELAQSHERALEQSSTATMSAPKTFKCLTWGSVAECMGYIYRRAVENRGAVARTQPTLNALRKEIFRRVFGRFSE